MDRLKYRAFRWAWERWHMTHRRYYDGNERWKWWSEGRPWWHMCCNGDGGGWRTRLCDYFEYSYRSTTYYTNDCCGPYWRDMMSRFYSSIQGNRGEATRRGHTEIRASAQSFEGSVVTTLFMGGREKSEVWCSLSVQPGSARYHGSGGQSLYYGPIAKLLDRSGRNEIVRTFALEELERTYGND